MASREVFPVPPLYEPDYLEAQQQSHFVAANEAVTFLPPHQPDDIDTLQQSDFLAVNQVPSVLPLRDPKGIKEQQQPVGVTTDDTSTVLDKPTQKCVEVNSQQPYGVAVNEVSTVLPAHLAAGGKPPQQLDCAAAEEVFIYLPANHPIAQQPECVDARQQSNCMAANDACQVLHTVSKNSNSRTARQPTRFV
jgi:hypothetical protein